MNILPMEHPGYGGRPNPGKGLTVRLITAVMREVAVGATGHWERPVKRSLLPIRRMVVLLNNVSDWDPWMLWWGAR